MLFKKENYQIKSNSIGFYQNLTKFWWDYVKIWESGGVKLIGGLLVVGGLPKFWGWEAPTNPTPPGGKTLIETHG